MNHKITLKIALLVLTGIFVSACQTTQTEDILVDPATDGQGQTDGMISISICTVLKLRLVCIQMSFRAFWPFDCHYINAMRIGRRIS